MVMIRWLRFSVKQSCWSAARRAATPLQNFGKVKGGPELELEQGPWVDDKAPMGDT